MEFNHDPYYQALTAEREALVADPDESWKATVHDRYALFLIEKSINQLGHHLRSLKIEGVDDRKALLVGASQALAGLSGELAFAATLLRYNCAVRDPIEAEAAMRLYYRAATPG